MSADMFGQSFEFLAVLFAQDDVQGEGRTARTTEMLHPMAKNFSVPAHRKDSPSLLRVGRTHTVPLPQGQGIGAHRHEVASLLARGS